MTVKELLQPFWFLMGALACTLILELLNSAFRQELNKLFKGWDSTLHEITSDEHSAILYWDLVDFIKLLMKKSINMFTFFAAAVVIVALMFWTNGSAAILSFCLGIITYRFAIFNNWLGLKKYGADKRPDRDGGKLDE